MASLPFLQGSRLSRDLPNAMPFPFCRFGGSERDAMSEDLVPSTSQKGTEFRMQNLQKLFESKIKNPRNKEMIIINTENIKKKKIS